MAIWVEKPEYTIRELRICPKNYILNEGVIKQELKELARHTVAETLNNLLDQEATVLIDSEKYERSEDRKGHRSRHYQRNLVTTSGEVKPKVPKLKGVAR